MQRAGKRAGQEHGRGSDVCWLGRPYCERAQRHVVLHAEIAKGLLLLLLLLLCA